MEAIPLCLFVQSNKTQVYLNQFICPRMYATYFSLYLGRLLACQYKEHVCEDTIKFQENPFLWHNNTLIKYNQSLYTHTHIHF